MQKITLKNLVLPVAATALTVVTLANAAITPAFPTVADDFAVSGEQIKAVDINTLAEGINNLDQRAWVEGTGYMSAPNSVDGVVVTDDGNVGIGTTTPTQKLHVNGYGLFNNPNSNIELNLLPGLVTGENHIHSYDRDNGAYADLLFRSNDVHFLKNNSNPLVTMKSDTGNVGIGTTTPMHNLSVGSKNGGSMLNIRNFDASGNIIEFESNAMYEQDSTRGGQLMRFDSRAGQPAISFFVRDVNEPYMGTGGQTMVISHVGNVGIGTASPSTKLHVVGTITETSDERLKENITPVANALEKITQLNGVSFDWIDAEKMDDNTHLGLIAQNVETVFPELVFTEETEFGTKSVNYDGLMGPMVEAMKEQQTQIEALQEEIALLKAAQ